MKKLLLCAFLLLPIGSALAQPAPVEVITGGIPVSGSNPFPISGSFSATLSGWPGTSQTTGTPIAVTTGGVSGTLPTGTVVLATNVGSNTAYCKLGASATTSDTPIFANSSVAFTVGTNTQLTCITSTSTTTVNMSGGSGLPTGWGGGGTGGGGGGNVNITQIASSTNGITTWGTAPTGASVLGVNANVLSAAPNTTATGNITSTQTVVITPTAGQSTIGIQVAGTWTGTLFVEGSVDGTNYIQTTVIPVLSGSVQTATITASGMYQANLAGFASFRIRGNSIASGTAVVTLIGTTGTATVMADNPFPVTGYTGMTALNVVGNTAIGSATTDKPLMIGGTSTGASGGNAQVAKVDSSGNLYALATLQASATTPIGKVDPNTIGNWGLAPSTQNGTTPTNSQLVMAQFNTTPTTITSGNVSPLQLDNAGNLLVNIKAGGGSGGTSSNFGSAFPTAGTAIGLTNGTNMVAWSATTNYGTAPAAIAVPAVNAFVTNASADPCTGTKSFAPINLTASGQLITGTAAKKTYICSINIVSATAQNIALVEGTGTTCATNIFGLAGGTTAATGWNFAANGGLTQGAGVSTIVEGSGDANATAANVCLLLSGTGQTSGSIGYVQQ